MTILSSFANSLLTNIGAVLRHSPKSKRKLLALTIAAFSFGSIPQAQAAIYNWNGGVGNWDTATANWSGAGTTWPAASTTNDDAIFDGTAGTVTLTTGITANDLTFNATGYIVTGNTLALDGTTPTINVATTAATINSTIAGSAGLTKTGTGTLTIGSANLYTGGTVISQGTIISGNASALGSSPITLGDGSTGSNNVRLQFNAANTLGQVGDITVANTGSSGTATLAVNNGAQPIKIANIVLNRATVFAGLGTTANNQVIEANISGPGAGAGSDTVIVDSGVGNALTMYVPPPTGQNTYSGNLRVKSGTLQIGNYTFNPYGNIPANQNRAIPDTASVTLDAGTELRFVWTGAEAFDALNGAGAFTRNTGDGQGNVMLTIGTSNGSGAFSGTITSEFSITKTGTGTQTFSGANSYGGTTTIKNGTLSLGGGNDRLPTGTAVTIGDATTNDSGIFKLNGSNQTIASLAVAGTGTANKVVNGNATAAVLTINNSAANAFAGVLGGTGTNENNFSVVKSGTGTLTLNGSNMFTGVTTGDFTGLRISGGIVSTNLVALNNLPSGIGGGSASLGLNGGTFQYTGSGGTIERRLEVNTTAGSAIDASGTGALTWLNTGGFGGAGIGGTRTLTLTGTSTLLNNMAVQLNNPGNSANVLSMAKTGAGTWVLSAANGYTGSTTVTAGSLFLNGSNSSSAVSVANTGTLGGTGSVSGTVSILTGGKLTPGASIESLSSGALTMASGSTFIYEALDNSATGADLMKVNGALSLTDVTLDLATANLAAGTWIAGDKLTLISYTGSEITTGFSGYADDSAYSFGSNNWVFNYNDAAKGANFSSEATGTSFVTLTYIAVPEPTTWAAIMLGGAGLCMLRRKRS